MSISSTPALLLEKQSDLEIKREFLAEHEAVWSNFLELLKLNIPENEIRTWFSIIKPKSFENNILTISVPSEDYYGIIEKRYNKFISNIISSGLLGENGKLQYEIKDAVKEPVKQENNAVENVYSIRQNVYRNDIQPVSEETTEVYEHNLNPKYIFEHLVKGESNELAVEIAYAITNNPGKAYNPFFVYGGVGLGKTHLIHAIGNEIMRKSPGKKIFYTTTPDFTNRFIDSISKNRAGISQNASSASQLDSFYKSLDVLIIDDIQNLSGKDKTQDFMYQIFNSLFAEGKHIIFSSDKPINQIQGIEERLISRFQWGLTIDIQPPSWEMRVAIIKKKLDEYNMTAPDDVIHYIATNVKDSIRTIEGCIIGITSESVFSKKGEITLEIAEKVIGRVVGHVKRTKNITIESIISTSASFFNVSENQILSKKRTKEVAYARQVSMYLAKELTTYTLQTIGLNFGGKDHATVLYAYNTISEQSKTNHKTLSDITELKERIRQQ
ncbi:MAG: chromosomal replication initiator protein DnaA [Ignavibacteria bacterium]|nr:chromosomal replication initiator protein DnaA [Ignavibacteria bacterium]